jgi:hypothetical protein
MAGFHKAAGFKVFHSPFTKGWMFTAVVNGFRFSLRLRLPVGIPSSRSVGYEVAASPSARCSSGVSFAIAFSRSS